MGKVNYAAIDIGSNAVRLLIKRVNEEVADDLFTKELLLRVPLRLGQDAFTMGEISKEKAKKLLRFNKIIKEASEQSKRSKLCVLKDVIEFKEIANYPADYSLIAYENTDFTSQDLIELLPKLKNKTINVIVGAEGGISKSELEIAKKTKYQEISLGKRILRSETACIFILSLISLYLD